MQAPCSLLSGSSSTLCKALVQNLINPALLLLTGVAGLIFFWGVVQFLWNIQKGGDTKDGKMHMLWGVIGLFIMLAAWGILTIIENTVVGLAGGS